MNSLPRVVEDAGLLYDEVVAVVRLRHESAQMIHNLMLELGEQLADAVKIERNRQRSLAELRYLVCK